MKIISDKEKWNNIITSFPMWDPAHEWGYFEAFRKKEGRVKPILFYKSNGSGKVAYPFFLKEESATETGKSTKKSLRSVYGYTGPLLEGDETIWADFLKDFRLFCEENQIVKIDERFHPVLKNDRKLFSQSKLECKRNVIALETLKSEEEIFASYIDRDIRKKIRKAKKNDLKIINSGEVGIDHFIKLYEMTM